MELRLQLSIANHDEVTRVFLGLVLAEGSDGTLQEGEPFGPIAVGAGENESGSWDPRE